MWLHVEFVLSNVSNVVSAEVDIFAGWSRYVPFAVVIGICEEFVWFCACSFTTATEQLMLNASNISTSVHTHTRLTAVCPGLPGLAGTRKVKPIWILLKQETVSGSGISWTICKSAPRSRQITMPAPHHSVF